MINWVNGGGLIRRTPTALPGTGTGAAGRLGGADVRQTEPVMTGPPARETPVTRPLAERRAAALPPGPAPRTPVTAAAGGASSSGAPRPLAEDRRLLDPAVLKHEMGRTPKLWSTRYNEVIKGLTSFNQMLREPVSADPARRAGQLTRIEAALDRALTAATAHAGSHGDPAMRTLAGELRQQKLVLQNLVVAPGRDGSPPSFRDLLGANAVGMSDRARTDFATYNEGNETSRTVLGKGQINTAYRVAYRSGEAMVLKPMPARDPGMPPAAKLIGIDPGNPRYASRNVATAVVDQALGFGLAPRTHFARDGAQTGLVMELVRGQSPLSLDPRPLPMTEMDHETVAGLTAEPDDPLHKATVAMRGLAKGPDGSWGRFATVADQFDSRDPVLMQGLSRLEWLDKVCGQVDRHPGNYMIDRAASPHPPPAQMVTGVKGIDNDFSFGAAHDDPTRRDASFNDVGLPLLVDQETHDRLHAMQAGWNAPDGMKAQLGALLKPEEVTATKARLDRLVTHSEDLAGRGRLVPTGEWGTWRSGTDGLSAHQVLTANENLSYLGRMKTQADVAQAAKAGLAAPA